MAEPRITVVMPVFNAGRYLRPAVLSIIWQTFSDWELLIIDDGSTDGAIEGVSDIFDPRIRLIRNPDNIGLAATLNVGIDLARGEFVARMDQDDIAYPERFEKQIKAFERDASLDLVAVRCLTISPSNEAVGVLPYFPSHKELTARPWIGIYLPHPTWMGKAKWFRKHRYHLPEYYLSEDQELLLRSHSTSRFATVPEVLFGYRLRSTNKWKRLLKSRQALMKVQVGHFVRTQQSFYALLSIFVFCARIAMDAVNSCFSKGVVGAHKQMKVGDRELERWQSVLDGLALSSTGNSLSRNEPDRQMK